MVLSPPGWPRAPSVGQPHPHRPQGAGWARGGAGGWRPAGGGGLPAVLLPPGRVLLPSGKARRGGLSRCGVGALGLQREFEAGRCLCCRGFFPPRGWGEERFSFSSFFFLFSFFWSDAPAGKKQRESLQIQWKATDVEMFVPSHNRSVPHSPVIHRKPGVTFRPQPVGRNPRRLPVPGAGAGPGQPGKSLGSRGNLCVPPSGNGPLSEICAACSSGALPAPHPRLLPGRFPDGDGKSQIRAMEHPGKCLLLTDFPFPPQGFKGFERRANAELRGAATFPRLRALAGGGAGDVVPKGTSRTLSAHRTGVPAFPGVIATAGLLGS